MVIFAFSICLPEANISNIDVITNAHHPNHSHNKILTDQTFPEFVDSQKELSPSNLQ